MITVLHGDNQKDSRSKLLELTRSLQKDGVEIRNLEGERITRTELETELLATPLFAQNALAIEGLLTRPNSIEKEACIRLLANYKGDKSILLWEKKEVPKKALQLLAGAKPKVDYFKLPMHIFKFLAELAPGQTEKSLTMLHAALETADNTFIFTMLARQISKLIIAKTEPGQLTGAPWQNKQVVAQANKWTLRELKHIHSKLLDIDMSIKTGGSDLDLTSHLDLLILER